MPISSAIWDDYTREFGQPAAFVAEENGERIAFKPELLSDYTPPQ